MIKTTSDVMILIAWYPSFDGNYLWVANDDDDAVSKVDVVTGIIMIYCKYCDIYVSQYTINISVFMQSLSSRR